MVDVNAAVRACRAFFTGIDLGIRLDSLEVDEVELTEDGRYWMITLGFTREPKGPLPLLARPSDREYRVFKVSNNEGQVISMRIREPLVGRADSPA